MVVSSLFSSSRFCATCSSFFEAMLKPPQKFVWHHRRPLPGRSMADCCSGDLYAARLVTLGTRQEDRQDALPILGLDSIRRDLPRQRQLSVELAGDPLPPMQTRL